jgi:hypothetical protein
MVTMAALPMTRLGVGNLTGCEAVFARLFCFCQRSTQLTRICDASCEALSGVVF